MALLPERWWSSLRTLLGEWAGDRDAPAPPLPDALPQQVTPLVADGVAMLMHYQGIAYVRLYLQRIRRFVGRPGVDADLLATIVQLTARRMAYPDPMRLAQLALDDASQGQAEPRDCVFRLDNLVELLPEGLAEPLVELVRWIGLSHLSVRRRFDARPAWRRLTLRIDAGLRRWRGLGLAARRERRAVERWLHMIDRALTLGPEMAPALARSAALVEGCGTAYQQRLADWHAIIDALAKPHLEGVLPLSDPAAAIDQACSAATVAPEQLRAIIASLRPAARRNGAGANGGDG